jgi:hypothetical protein
MKLITIIIFLVFALSCNQKQTMSNVKTTNLDSLVDMSVVASIDTFCHPTLDLCLYKLNKYKCSYLILRDMINNNIYLHSNDKNVDYNRMEQSFIYKFYIDNIDTTFIFEPMYDETVIDQNGINEFINSRYKYKKISHSDYKDIVTFINKKVFYETNYHIYIDNKVDFINNFYKKNLIKTPNNEEKIKNRIFKANILSLILKLQKDSNYIEVYLYGYRKENMIDMEEFDIALYVNELNIFPKEFTDNKMTNKVCNLYSFKSYYIYIPNKLFLNELK